MIIEVYAGIEVYIPGLNSLACPAPGRVVDSPLSKLKECTSS